MKFFRRAPPSLLKPSPSPEAIARAFGSRLVREFGEDASRLMDIGVAQVQAELRALRGHIDRALGAE